MLTRQNQAHPFWKFPQHHSRCSLDLILVEKAADVSEPVLKNKGPHQSSDSPSQWYGAQPLCSFSQHQS